MPWKSQPSKIFSCQNFLRLIPNQIRGKSLDLYRNIIREGLYGGRFATFQSPDSSDPASESVSPLGQSRYLRIR